MRVSRADYSRMTYAEYLAMVEGYQISQQKEWERFRWLGVAIVNQYAKQPIKDPRKLMKLPLIDKVEPALNKEQMKAIIELAKMQIPN